MMQAQSTRPVRTFTIGYREQGYDEAQHAARVAQYIGTNHTEFYVTDADAAAVVPALQAMYDEPFGDASAIPTHLVAQLARRHVVVSLSGDGGDELFGGYTRYVRTARHWSVLRSMPLGARRCLARVAAVTPAVADRYPSLPSALASRDVVDLYRGLLQQWPTIGDWSSAGGEAEPSGWRPVAPSGIEQMMLEDSVTYLPDDVLCKVDRAAMAVSLETRVPMLDHGVVEYAWSLPLSFKVRGDRGKWLLRHLLARYVPPELTERPKMGFAVPVDVWIRGRLRDWAEDLLSESSLRRHDLFDVAVVRRRWGQHVAGTRNWRDPLWILLQLQAWVRLHLP
jgi:asparagine synthase (glutamine-hydrolysing)